MTGNRIHDNSGLRVLDLGGIEPSAEIYLYVTRARQDSREVGCMICGKTGMKTLKRHLATAHDLKPGKYRKQFSIPKDQPLAATGYVEKRRQAALDRGLGEKMAAARAAKKAKLTGE